MIIGTAQKASPDVDEAVFQNDHDAGAAATPGRGQPARPASGSRANGSSVTNEMAVKGDRHASGS